MTQQTDIVIVGAGIGGLAMACGIAYSQFAEHFKIRILEYRDSDDQQGYPIRLSKTGQDALASLLTPFDLSLIAAARGRLPVDHDGLSVMTDQGRRCCVFFGKSKPQMGSMIERQDLIQILKNALKHKNVEVEYGVKVNGVDDGKEGWFCFQRTRKERQGMGKVVVTTNHGVIQCDLVIGADGMFSSTRNNLYPNGKAQALPLGKIAHNYRLSYVAMQDYIKDSTGINVVLGDKWAATLIPVRPASEGNEENNEADEGEVYCVITTLGSIGPDLDGLEGPFIDHVKQEPAARRRQVLEAVKEKHGNESVSAQSVISDLSHATCQADDGHADETTGLLKATQPPDLVSIGIGEIFSHQQGATSGTIHGMSTPLYTCRRTYTGKPRIAIIGDASHGMTPFAGSGASCALRDAADLVKVLERRVDLRRYPPSLSPSVSPEGPITRLFDRLCGQAGKNDCEAMQSAFQHKAERKARKDMWQFNARLKRRNDRMILASSFSLWMAVGESSAARGTRRVVFSVADLVSDK